MNLKRVRKIGGSYQHTGVVVAEFKTTAGQDRLVVEFDAPTSGMLHILRPDQVVEISTDPATGYVNGCDNLNGHLHLHARRHHRMECQCSRCRSDGREECSEKKPCGTCRRVAREGERR
jgi:hypothetical protein